MKECLKHHPSWIVDSGASSHIMQRKELLVNYEEFDKPQKVSMGDSHMVEAFGKGDIRFTMTLENDRPKTVTMSGTLYVPKLTCSLFSVRATVMKGNTAKFKNGTVQLISKLTLACSNTNVFLYFCRVTRTKLACDTRVIFRVEHTSSILCAVRDTSSCAARL